MEAFCHYHYRFHVTRLLQQPIDGVLAIGETNFPFCLCWANEPWSRTWLGDEREVLMAQLHSREDDRDSPVTRLMFLNAWNESAEANRLELDRQYGHAFVEQRPDALADHERRCARSRDRAAMFEVAVEA